MGRAYIHVLKDLLEETMGYVPEELATRVAERCAFTDVHWARDVGRIQELLRSAAARARMEYPTTARKRKSPPHQPEEMDGWPEDDERFYRCLSRFVGVMLTTRADVERCEQKGLSKSNYFKILTAISPNSELQLGSWAELRNRYCPDKLSLSGSAQVLRAARVFVRALLLFGTRPPTTRWMLQLQPWEGHEKELSPLTLCVRSEQGARQVEQELTKTYWGIF